MLRILIIRVSSLGDVVHNLPVVADILRHHPDAQIDWLVEEAFVSLVRQVAGVRYVIPFALRRWRKRWWKPSIARQTAYEIHALYRALHRERYDCIIDCQGLVKTALAGCLAWGPVVGLGNRSQDSSYEWPAKLFYRRSIPLPAKLHVIERSRQLVAAALNIPAPQAGEQIDFGLHVPAIMHGEEQESARAQAHSLPPPPYLVFIHATSRADKEWPLASWIALGQKAVQQGWKIVLPWGSAAERQTSAHIAAACGEMAHIPERFDWPEVLQLLGQANAVVGVDTGLVHIATALKRPTIQLYNFDTAWRVGGYAAFGTVNLGGAAHPPQLHEVEQILVRWGIFSAS